MIRNQEDHTTGGKFFFALIIFALLAPLTSGSCLSYGHSCWGAHGKRNGGPVIRVPLMEGDSSGPNDAGGGSTESRWFLSKFIPSSGSFSSSTGNFGSSSEESRHMHPLLGDNQNEELAYNDEDDEGWQRNNLNEPMSEKEILIMAAEPKSKRTSRKMKLYKILKKRSTGAIRKN